MQIVVVGSVALDTIATPTAEEILGGSATYFAIAASHRASVRLVGVAGTDFPEKGRKALEQRGVDIEGLELVEGKTFRWGGRYHADMNRRDTLFTHLNVFEHFHPKLPQRYRDSEIVFLANIHPALQLEVLDQVDAPKLVAMDTMNLWIDIARPDLLEVLKRVDLLFLNDEEARQLSGRHQTMDAIRAVQAMGPKTVVVKKGEHGAVIVNDEMRFALPAVLLDHCFDPTGAGDAFAGGFIGEVARRGDFSPDSFREAMIEGTVIASYATEDFGVDRLVALEKDAFRARRDQLSQLVRWPKSSGVVR